MIISRAPFRISFVGGGTDFEDYYKLDGGAVISTTINKYIYATVNHKFDDKIHLRYSEFECVDSIDELKHNIARETMRLSGVNKAVEIVTISDIPTTGSGLGSSGALTLVLLKALYAYKGYPASCEFLANLACKLEIEILGYPIGKQDQYSSAYGGLNQISFKANGEVDVENLYICAQYEKIKWLEESSMLFYLDHGHQSLDILVEHKKEIANKKYILDEQRDLVKIFKEWLCNNNYRNKNLAGQLVNLSWKCKKEMTPKASNDNIDRIIKLALDSGACGAKVCGSGAGGFLLVLCDKDKQHWVRESLSNLKELNFKFEEEGVEDIYVP